MNDWLQVHARQSPNTIAIQLPSWYPDKTNSTLPTTFTYRELECIVATLTKKVVVEYELAKGDRIAIVSKNSLEHILLFFVAQKTGCILVPINNRLAAPEIHAILCDCTPSLIIYDVQFEDCIQSYLKNVDNKQSIIPMEICELHNEIVHTSSITTNNENTDIQTEILENDALFILYTSGTTGLPKGVLYTYKMLFWNSINTGLRLDITSEDSTAVILPLFHTGGWNVLTTPILHRAGNIHVMPEFDAEKTLQYIEKHRLTILMVVPTMLNMMSESKVFDEVDLSSLRYIIVGGEALSEKTIFLWEKKGIPLRQGYGLTEAGPSITSLHHSDTTRKRGSIGTPNMYLDWQITDEHGSIIKEAHQDGELWLSGDVVFQQYWNNEKATNSTFVEVEYTSGHESSKKKWLKTGDIVRKDEEGFLYVTDRKKNMFISGGENVYPAEIEKVLLQHPQIREAAITSVPNDKWGEVGKAWVLLKDKDEEVTHNDIKDYLRSQLAPYKVPKTIQFCSELPKNALGKIDRKLLQQTL